MKQFTFLTIIITAFIVIIVSSCDSKREPGKVYMPDMAYSRAIETYAQLDSAFTIDSSELGYKIFYNRKPVDSTIKRGGLFPFLPPPPTPDSSGYKMSASIKNPLTTPLMGADSVEASRLFNINCGICHGTDGKASGPLAKSGKFGGVKDLTSAEIVNLADGTIYYSVTYGKNNMGSYASQLDRKQRWMIVQYVRMLQPKPSATPSMAKTDSTATAKK
jgi:mono/diheme cytochrome c family protein